MKLTVWTLGVVAIATASCGVLNKKDDDTSSGNDKPQTGNVANGGGSTPTGGGTPITGGVSSATGLEAVQGKWVGDCFESNDLSNETILSNQTVMIFNGNHLTVSSNQFSDTKCKTPSAIVDVVGSVSTIGNSVKHSGGQLLKQSFDQYFYTLANADLVQLFNDAAVCGITDWNQGERRQVQPGESCISAEDTAISKPIVTVPANGTLTTYDNEDATEVSFVGRKQ